MKTKGEKNLHFCSETKPSCNLQSIQVLVAVSFRQKTAILGPLFFTIWKHDRTY